MHSRPYCCCAAQLADLLRLCVPPPHTHTHRSSVPTVPEPAAAQMVPPPAAQYSIKPMPARKSVACKPVVVVKQEPAVEQQQQAPPAAKKQQPKKQDVKLQQQKLKQQQLEELQAEADAAAFDSDSSEPTSAHAGGKRRRRIRNAKQQELNRLAQQRYRCGVIGCCPCQLMHATEQPYDVAAGSAAVVQLQQCSLRSHDLCCLECTLSVLCVGQVRVGRHKCMRHLHTIRFPCTCHLALLLTPAAAAGAACRERRKQKYSSLQDTVEELSGRLGQLSTLEAANNELQQRNTQLEVVVKDQNTQLQVQKETITRQAQQLQSQVRKHGVGWTGHLHCKETLCRALTIATVRLTCFGNSTSGRSGWCFVC